jgi:ferredoxin
MFRVIVDAETCESNGFCVGFAPDVFELGNDSPPVRVLASSFDESLRADVEQAVTNCPRQAIRIESRGPSDVDG